MTHPTINREPAVDLFHQIMHPQSTHWVLRLLGEGKMGKSHLLTKVFPLLARQSYQAAWAVVDLRGGITAPDILHQSCAQLGGETRFPSYYAAYENWLNQPRVEVKGLQALLSSISIRAGEQDTDPRRVERLLTTKFIADLQTLAPDPVLLMFDALEQSDPAIQHWLMNELLVSLTPLQHVRVVLAGRAIPDAAGSYAACCHSYELVPVRDETAYIVFCQQLNLTITEQSIRDFALVFDYKPGFFVDFVLPKFSQAGAAHE
ncbi:MAG: ATP-binding protein [Anaerolineae bacterium]|nr:ATP-binding protein [Anaerolineae bacterium]